MYAVEWAENREATWTGQGYAEAPWLARKYDTRDEALARACRVNGVVILWAERKREKKEAAPVDDGCPF